MEEKKRKEEQAALANVPSFLVKTYDIVNVRVLSHFHETLS